MNFEDIGYVTTDAIFMETSAEPVTIPLVTMGAVVQGSPTSILAQLSAEESPEENIILRYTTDDFANSTYIAMNCTTLPGLGTACTAQIPNQPTGTTVKYYVLSSTLSTANIAAEPDLGTINLNNNGGANYMYTEPALPVELLSFEVKTDRDESLLTWTTATELNNDRFEVERSADGKNYETLGSVAGMGTTETEQEYRFTDRQPLNGTSYYRLRQIDFDGAFEYSPVVIAERKTETVTLFPNPVQGVLNYRLSSEFDSAVLTVRDARGATVLSQMVAPNGQLSTSDWTPGLYLVEIRDRIGRLVHTQRVIR